MSASPAASATLDPRSASRARLRSAARLVARVQWRSRFPHLYFAAAAVGVVALRLAIPTELLPRFAPALLLGEITGIAPVLAAANVFLARGEGSSEALAVSPLRPGEYVLALVGVTAALATASGVLLYGGLLGLGSGFWLALPSMFLCGALCGALGVGLSTAFDEFTRFLLGAVPLIVLLGVPMLAGFGLVPWAAVAWLPTTPAMLGFGGTGAAAWLAVPWLGAWAGLALWWARHRFEARIHEPGRSA